MTALPSPAPSSSSSSSPSLPFSLRLRSRLRLAVAVALSVGALAVAGCAKPAGGPLTTTFDATRLASLSLDAKQAVAQAQQQHDLALQQHARAQDAYSNSEIEQEIAEYQAQSSVLVSQLVSTRLNDKPKTGPETAALARRTAEAKVEFTRARREWLRLLTSSTHYAVYATQAKLELERAKLAQANGLTAAGFDLAGFENQLAQRERAARAAADETDRQHGVASGKLTAWNELERSFMQTSGIKGPSESDRAVLDWKQAPTAPATIQASAPGS